MHAANYKRIANILGGDYACADSAGRAALFCATLSLADYFKQENENFDRGKFYAAVFGEDNPLLDRLTF